MREYDFMGDQGGPFKGCNSVGLSAADQFVLAVGQFDEFRLPELPDQLPGSAEWNEVVQFHTQSHDSSGLSDGFMWSPFE
jgi:hypothetical protein